MTSIEPKPLQIMTAGSGTVQLTNAHTYELRLARQSEGYGLSQMDDYQLLARADFLWKPPVKLSLIARVSLSDPKGTFGFGFWNDPFSMLAGPSGSRARLPASPQALWFFYGSPPNDMALADPVPGHGWKAAVLRGPPLPSLLLVPAGSLAFLAAQLPLIRSPVMKAAIATVEAQESLLEVDPAESHHYALEWQSNVVRFAVDGERIFESSVTPRAPLGFVAWIDNQYAIASPSGGLKFGVLPTSREQALQIHDLTINGHRVSVASHDDA